MTAVPLLELQDVTTGYGDIPVVRGVTLRFGTGLMTAIIGSNGAGKSTVIKAAAGLLRVWSGQVLAGGTDVTREAAHKRLARGIAYVPQGRIVVPEMTVRDNLELGADRTRIAAAIDRLVALFPVLGQRMRQHAGTMSGGEQQMLAIARALVTGPTTIILDEPSLGLSPKYVDVVFQALTDLCATGLTVVIVEQKATRALAVAQYGYVMHTGRIAYDGPAAQLLANEDVKRLFLGDVPEGMRALEDAEPT